MIGHHVKFCISTPNGVNMHRGCVEIQRDVKTFWSSKLYIN